MTLRWPALVATLALLALAGGAAAWHWLRGDIVRWMERDTLAEVTRLTEKGDLYEAFRLVRGVQERIPDDPEVHEMVDRITIPISIVTEPPGATVHLKGYATPDAPWMLLGETPLPGVRVPYALTHWKIDKEGFEPFEGAPFGVRPFTAFAQGFALDPVGSRPDGMVRVPGGPFARLGFPPVELGDYWLDRYEVTNREFKEFVDAGGYEKEAYWTEPFVEEGRVVPREEAMARLVDTTGRPGPAGWEFGSYGEGRGRAPGGRRELVRGRGLLPLRRQEPPHPLPLVRGRRPGPALRHRPGQQLRRGTGRHRWEATRAWATSGPTTWPGT